MILSATLLKVHSKLIGLKIDGWFRSFYFFERHLSFAVFQASGKYWSLIMVLIMLQIATICMREKFLRTPFEIPGCDDAWGFVFVDRSENFGNFAWRGWYEISVCWFKSSGIVIDFFVKVREFFESWKWSWPCLSVGREREAILNQRRWAQVCCEDILWLSSSAWD